MYPHLRVARPTDHMPDILRFYRDGLGFEVIASFENHEGFDGTMLGHSGAAYHLEFTVKHGHIARRAPTQDNLLVFYLPDSTAYQQTLARMIQQGFAPVPAFNPYWDKNGTTFEDADGYRIVLQHAEWSIE